MRRLGIPSRGRLWSCPCRPLERRPTPARHRSLSRAAHGAGFRSASMSTGRSCSGSSFACGSRERGPASRVSARASARRLCAAPACVLVRLLRRAPPFRVPAVDRMNMMLGSYAPKAEQQHYTAPPTQYPANVFARGGYIAECAVSSCSGRCLVLGDAGSPRCNFRSTFALILISDSPRSLSTTTGTRTWSSRTGSRSGGTGTGLTRRSWRDVRA